MTRQILFSLLLAAFAAIACQDSRQDTSTQVENENARPVLASDTAAPVAETPPSPPTSREIGTGSKAEQAQSPVAEPPAGAGRENAPPAPAAKPAFPRKQVKPDNTGVGKNTLPAQLEDDPAKPSQPTILPSQTVEKQPVEQKSPAPQSPVQTESAAAPQPPSHDAWDKLLQQHVSAAGLVDYAGFKKDKSKLDAYLQDLAAHPPQNDWSKAEKMAFWINVYNAHTIKLIVENYPLASITKLDGGKTWDVQRIKIGGKTYSLNNVENDILRPQFKDARIHFAVNCAARSCPPLLNRAWTAANLEANFEKQTKAFVNHAQFNKISAGSAEVSKIFEWYAADFGNLIEFLNRYSSVKIKPGAKVKYLEYDWSLNSK